MKNLFMIPFVVILAVIGAVAFLIMMLGLIVLSPVIAQIESFPLHKSYNHD